MCVPKMARPEFPNHKFRLSHVGHFGCGGGGGVWGSPPLGFNYSKDAPPRVTFRRVDVPVRGPGQSPVLPFACCVGSLRSVGRCGRCSCWCRFRVRGAQSLVCWGCAECLSPNHYLLPSDTRIDGEETNPQIRDQRISPLSTSNSRLSRGFHPNPVLSVVPPPRQLCDPHPHHGTDTYARTPPFSPPGPGNCLSAVGHTLPLAGVPSPRPVQRRRPLHTAPATPDGEHQLHRWPSPHMPFGFEGQWWTCLAVPSGPRLPSSSTITSSALLCPLARAQGCIRREGASEVAPEAGR